MPDRKPFPQSSTYTDVELKEMYLRPIHLRNMELHEQYFINHSGTSDLWTLDRSTRKLPASFPLHVHTFCEIYLFFSGSVNYLIENEIYQLKENDILIIPAGCTHQTLVQNDNDHYERINLWIKQEAFDKLSTKDLNLSACLSKETVRSNFLIPNYTNENKLIRSAIEQLEILQSKARFGREVSIQDFLRQIVIYAHHYCTSDLAGRIQTQAQSNPLVSAAIASISENLSSPITLDSISNALYVSKYHLAHTFKQHMGVSVHQYIINLRLVKAKQMIDSGVNLNEICEACGFSNYSNFYKLFKARMGISPTQYRDLIWNEIKKPEE